MSAHTGSTRAVAQEVQSLAILSTPGRRTSKARACNQATKRTAMSVSIRCAAGTPSSRKN